MTAIYKKEVKGFFTSMVGYVFIGFLLVVCGIYFTAYHLQAMYPRFAYTLQAVVFAFLIVVPILSMRVLAEERKQKTDQLLLTSPVSVSGIVVGKYLALVTVYAVTVAILAVYPLILTQFGNVPMLETYSALFGFFLMGSCYLAVGLFISSVTESQVIAAVLTFLVLFVCYVSQGIATFFPETSSASYFTLAVLVIVAAVIIYQILHQAIIAALLAVVCEAGLLAVYLINASFYEGLIQKMFGVLDLTAPFTEFSSGMFDVTGVVFYLTFIGVFLFLTVQSIQKRRWGGGRRLKNGSYSIAMTAIVIAGAIAVNLVVSELPVQYTQIDVSEEQLSSISDQTKELLAGLDKDVTIYYLVQGDNKDSYVSHLLERYEGYSPHIKLVEKDPVISPNFASQYTEETLPDNSVIVTCNDSNRVISYNDMYESEFNYNYYTYETTGFDGEGQITSAIAAVSSEDLPKLYTLTGHGELEINTTYAQSIEKENIETAPLNLITADQVPEDADCLLIASPTSDFSDAETQKILAYLKTGGKAIIVTDYSNTDMPNLESVLDYYGVSLVDGIVLEGNSNNYIQLPYYLVPQINSTDISSDMTGGSSYAFLPAAQGIRTLEDARETLTISGVLSTSGAAYSKTDVEGMTTYEKEDGDIAGPFDVGVIITETVVDATAEEGETETETGIETEAAVEESGQETEAEETAAAETKLAVFSSSGIIDASADQMVSGGNSKLFMNAVSWMCGHTTTVSVPVKSLSVDYLTVTAAGSSFWSILVIGIIPGAILIAGLVIWLRRRKQ